MATSGTPHGGLDDIGALAYTSSYLTLVCYINTADSLGADTVAADLTQPTTANGYAPIVLDGVWTSTDGVLTYAHSVGVNNFGGHPGWQASGTWSAAVTGVALIHGSIVRHFKDLSTSFTAANLAKLVIDLSTVVA